MIRVERQVLQPSTPSTPTTSKPSPATTLFILHLEHGEDNRFSLAFMRALHAALDAVEGAIAAEPLAHVALVTTGRGRMYSNGLDLASAKAMGSPYFRTWHALMARFLVFPVPTIAGTCGCVCV